MSKTSQRNLSHKQSIQKLYDMGYRDGKATPSQFRWEDHPYMTSYEIGFKHGVESKRAIIKKKFFLQSFSFKRLFKKGGNDEI